MREIKRLPDYIGVADTCDDLFTPEECQPGEIIVRRGRLKSKRFGVVDGVLAYCDDEGIFSICLWTNAGCGWKFYQGGSSAESERAIRHVLKSDSEMLAQV